MTPVRLFSTEMLFVLAGVFLLLLAWQIARDAAHPRRWGSAAFWGLLGVTMALGSKLPPAAVGYAVLAMVALAATGQVKRGKAATTSITERVASAARLGNRVFLPALLIPAVAILGSLTLGKLHAGGIWLADPKQVTLISLGIGVVFAVLSGLRLTGERPVTAVNEGSRLLQSIGWALVLPQMLAALGSIFAKAGVGEVVADIVGRVLPTQYPFVAVVAYCVGMALFTICMGNAFAAFAVITGGIGLPLIVQHHHGNPAIMAAMGMLSGYCGTLVTPMAANFNLVPAILLELPDKQGVIKAQVPLAAVILIANILLMWACVYRF
jgi:uncharacterized membrane protein